MSTTETPPAFVVGTIGWLDGAGLHGFEVDEDASPDWEDSQLTLDNGDPVEIHPLHTGALIAKLQSAVVESGDIARECDAQATRAEHHARLLQSAVGASEAAREMALELSAELQSRIAELDTQAVATGNRAEVHLQNAVDLQADNDRLIDNEVADHAAIAELEAHRNMLAAINGQLEVDNGWAVDKANEHRIRVEELESENADKQNVIDQLAIQVERDEVRIGELEAEREQSMDDASIEPFVRLTQLQSEAVSGKSLTPDERRAQANRKAKNRRKRKASQRARKGARR